MNPDTSPVDHALQSGVVTSPADSLLSQAIALALAAPADCRATLFLASVHQIQETLAAQAGERPWTCRHYLGTDGSHIFRGGVGHSLVIDPAGQLWRARSYEDFETTYRLESGTCEIASLRPLYEQMRRYQLRNDSTTDGHVPPTRVT